MAPSLLAAFTAGRRSVSQGGSQPVVGCPLLSETILILGLAFLPESEVLAADGRGLRASSSLAGETTRSCSSGKPELDP